MYTQSLIELGYDGDTQVRPAQHSDSVCCASYAHVLCDVFSSLLLASDWWLMLSAATPSVLAAVAPRQNMTDARINWNRDIFGAALNASSRWATVPVQWNESLPKGWSAYAGKDSSGPGWAMAPCH
jgi:hypothetical protein